jgi:hypothetical protein
MRVIVVSNLIERKVKSDSGKFVLNSSLKCYDVLGTRPANEVMTNQPCGEGELIPESDSNCPATPSYFILDQTSGCRMCRLKILQADRKSLFGQILLNQI